MKQFEMQINPRLMSAANTLEGRSQTLLPGVAMMMMMKMMMMMMMMMMIMMMMMMMMMMIMVMIMMIVMMVMVMMMVMFGDDDSNDDTWRFMKIPRDSWKILEKKNKSDIIFPL